MFLTELSYFSSYSLTLPTHLVDFRCFLQSNRILFHQNFILSDSFKNLSHDVMRNSSKFKLIVMQSRMNHIDIR